MQDRIKQAFADLREARTALHAASEHELEAKEDLKDYECTLLLSVMPDGGLRINGKNADQREAQIRSETYDERSVLEKARQEKVKAQLAMDLAVMKCDELKWIIRAEFNELAD